jgi:hypothetical protein
MFNPTKLHRNPYLHNIIISLNIPINLSPTIKQIQPPVKSSTSTPLVLHADFLPLCPPDSFRTPLPSPVKSSASASSSVAARQVPGRESRRRRALDFGFLGLSLGSGLGLDLGVGAVWGGFWCDGGGGGGAMGEDERVIVSGAGFAKGFGCVDCSGFAVGYGVVRFPNCSGCFSNMKPPAVNT